ncbi:hypothetical protein BDZ94DRAFT_1251310 [Collybia nuda]|uniref:Uncharacterized protein n=1 Tax=Collybia nuda TaxID=64659 RepID=A0A9P5YC89_9AGAR|nr:hypothetical protein BDZ94DRAFT_1251310 [Collybia nuda]
MSSNNFNREHKPSDPIAINTSARRGRSASVSSGSSSATSSPELQTPASTSSSQRISIPSPGSSPILSYFLAQSPTNKTPASATFPFNRKFGPPPVFEEEEEVPAALHARRASTVVAGRFTQPLTAPLPESQSDRGTGLLRRLSLSNGAFAKPHLDRIARPTSPPSPPPNSAVSPTLKNAPFSRESKPRRSATINEGVRPRRAPSPMGERILKGHFDGFN